MVRVRDKIRAIFRDRMRVSFVRAIVRLGFVFGLDWG